MDIKILLCVLGGLGVLFLLPSTMYLAIFYNVFHRTKPQLLEKDDLTGTDYFEYREELKVNIEEAKKLPCERVEILSRDKKKLRARYYDNKSNTTIILSHGYRSTGFNNFALSLKEFLSYNYNVLMIDHRAHGESDGKFMTIGYKEQFDLLDWIDFATAKEKVDRVFLYGISMGATSVGLASNKIETEKVKGLILEAGFTCFYDEISFGMRNIFIKKPALNFVRLAAKTFLKADITANVQTSLADTNIPVLFLHGDTDKEVPLSFTEKNYSACKSKKELKIIKNAGHTLCFYADKEGTKNAVRSFLENN